MHNRNNIDKINIFRKEFQKRGMGYAIQTIHSSISIVILGAIN